MKFFTADICDQIKDNIQVLNPIFKSFGGVSLFHGKITTIELFEDNSDLVKLLRDEKGVGRVCIVDVKGKYPAVVGETLMGYAYKNGWAGIIINGYVRDTHQTSIIPVGLYALGTYPQKSIKKQSANRDIKLDFAGVTFTPDEYIYADNDGIIILKEELN